MTKRGGRQAITFFLMALCLGIRCTYQPMYVAYVLYTQVIRRLEQKNCFHVNERDMELNGRWFFQQFAIL